MSGAFIAVVVYIAVFLIAMLAMWHELEMEWIELEIKWQRWEQLERKQ